ncbi:cupin domain-containing protein [Bacteroides stercoris]|jgi:quercetin dioxygenase-like cupin family protein|uniref:cupin domain-containing protein n=1 Tax=Bacteroides stercoris TaxID=46506 RepID=UPI000E51493E|nr:cupin domain-containing protein [Bacteroides stercoris]RGT24411.1 cupin domain-containing protein [Bacteroides stercoris]RGZ89075.1 cupin domain-containing protein [Bacteroides stercoris]RHE82986.1 cupin domain-containing protein [Bacteroides stercoris]
MKKKIIDIIPISTTHGVGEKRVLLNSQETSTPLTQIAVTRLKAGEMAKEHLHPTMEEFFLFQKGDAIMTVGEEQITCSSGDFISIPANTLHALKAITDIEIITIGCAVH